MAAAGIFPFQGFAKRVGIASNQDQPGLARTMLRRAFTDLPGRREMNETVGPVFGGTGISSAGFRIPPFGYTGYMKYS